MIHPVGFIPQTYMQVTQIDTYLHIQRHTDIHTHIFTFTHTKYTHEHAPVGLYSGQNQSVLMSTHHYTCSHTVTHVCSHTHMHTHTLAHFHTLTIQADILTSTEMFTLMNCYIVIHTHTPQTQRYIFDTWR